MERVKARTVDIDDLMVYNGQTRVVTGYENAGGGKVEIHMGGESVIMSQNALVLVTRSGGLTSKRYDAVNQLTEGDRYASTDWDPASGAVPKDYLKHRRTYGKGSHSTRG